MAQNTTNNVTINAASKNMEEKNMINLAMKAETLEQKTVKELRFMASVVGLKGCSHAKKAELIAKLAPLCNEWEKTMVKNDYTEKKWDKLVKAVATEYVAQSLNVKWALFYKNTKSTTTKDDYLVKTKKLWGATSKVIKTIYGEKNCNINNIKQTLEAMVARGYLNYRKVTGLNNQVNIVYSASTNQMNAMYKLSK